MAVQHTVGLRRGVVILTSLLTLVWFVYSLVFLVDVYSPKSTALVGTSLALSFTCLVGVLLLLTLALFLSASPHILVMLDATHHGAALTFFVASFYTFLLLTTFLWLVSSEHAGEHAQRAAENLALFALTATSLITTLSIVATIVFSGLLVASSSSSAVVPVTAQHHHHHDRIRPPITSTSSRRVQRSGARLAVAAPTTTTTLTVAELFSPSMENSMMAQEKPMNVSTSAGSDHRDDATDAAYTAFDSYLVVPCRLNDDAARVLTASTYLSALFLVIMGLLALLESQHVHAIVQLWIYTILYGLIGGALLVLQICTLLVYAKAHPELTFRHTLPLNLNVTVSVTVWLYSLIVLALWLSSYAPPCCTDDVHASPRHEPAWTLYNNAVTTVASLSLLTVVTFVPAATAQLYPERREKPRINVGVVRW